MKYNEALEYIHSVNNFFCKPGLDRIKALCKYLGNPQDELKYVHVAGTNGKGSFCAMLSSILMDAGYKVGTYTSPYIFEFNERISINGQMIPKDDLVALCEYIKPFADKIEDKPTEFELITAMAFKYFKDQNCDIVILECGLGGRYDATNIITNPLLSVITGVDFDHQNFLGNTISEIANEKAGIIKQKVACLWCGKNDIADAVISKTAGEMGAPLFTPDYSSVNVKKTDLSGTVFDYEKFKSIELPLLSLYQPYNAANAITAAEILSENGFVIKEENIRTGLKNTQWRARFELLRNNPTIIFDGSHNPQGVTATVQSIKKYFGEQKVNILTGVMRDKDYRFIAKEISNVAKCVYCVTPDNPRALPSEDYCLVFKELNIPCVAGEDIKAAFYKAVDDSKQSSTPLICMGSLYMYGDIYKLINC